MATQFFSGLQEGNPTPPPPGFTGYYPGWGWVAADGKSFGSQYELNEYKKEQSNISMGLNPDGTPKDVRFTSLIDPSTGLLGSQYQLAQLQQGPGYEAFSKEALRQAGTESPWAKLAKERLDYERGIAAGDLAKQAAAGLATARSGLAMRGGASAGSRERLAGQSMRDLLLGQQELAGKAVRGRMDIMSQDEQNRLQMLGQLPGMELNLSKAQSDIKQYNIQNALNEIAKGRGFEEMKYQEGMKKWAAERQAQATERSGGGGK